MIRGRILACYSFVSSKDVLIVDDEAAIRETLQLILEIEGYSVHSAANGKEALERLRSIPRPCVILLDLMMPVMNGWQFVESLSQDTSLRGIPVIVITAFSERALTIQASRLLKKPLDVDCLLSTVKEFCD